MTLILHICGIIKNDFYYKSNIFQMLNLRKYKFNQIYRIIIYSLMYHQDLF